MTTEFAIDMKPVMLAYGWACYTAQNLESTLRFLLVVNLSHKNKQAVSTSAITAIETDTMREAVFSLFKKAKEKEYFTSKEEHLLKDAMGTRNYLMHEFWNKNILKASTPDGRSNLILELEKIQDQIRHADKIIVSLIDHYLVEYGLTTEIIKSIAMQHYEAGTLSANTIKH